MLSQAFGQLHGRLIVGISSRDSRRTKNCHRWPHAREHFERVYKFCHDPRDWRGILFRETKGPVIHMRKISDKREVTSIPHSLPRCSSRSTPFVRDVCISKLQV